MDDMDDAELLKLAQERFADAVAYDLENTEQARDDLRFLAGEQWPEEVRRNRELEHRPCLTINRLPQFVAQVEGDARQNRANIKVLPAEDGDVAVAEVFEGLIRLIEDRSDALGAYCHAIKGAASCGIGHFGLSLQDYGGYPELCVKRVVNHLAVVWDPAAEDPTKADARFCFVSTRLPRKEFEARYPDASPGGFDAGTSNAAWSTGDTVSIAEYWTAEDEQYAVVRAQAPDGSMLEREVTDDQSLVALEMAGVPYEIVQRTRKRVDVRLISATDVLEGPTRWPGERIPYFPVAGQEIPVDERIIRKGLITDAKDSQRLFNYMRSASAEMVGLAPKAPWLVTDMMIEGREDEWARANVDNAPYLSYSPDAEAPQGPQRVAPPPMQSAALQESMMASDDLKATTGIYDAALGNRSNETSGVAIARRQQEGDTATYIYHDNLRRAIAACGREMIRIIPRVYTERQQIRILGADMQPKIVLASQADLLRGEYDVTIDIAASYGTRRQEAAELFTQILQGNPSLFSLIGDLWAKSLDMPGSDEIAERLAAMVQQNQPQQPDPQAQQLQQVLQAMAVERQKAEIDKIRSETSENLASASLDQLRAQSEAIENELRRRAALANVRITL